jgi:hypothetical protein
MLKALGNVAPRHLLDTRLNPPAELRARAVVAAEGQKRQEDRGKQPDRPDGRSLPIPLRSVPMERADGRSLPVMLKPVPVGPVGDGL